jgi:hypothetical protein
MNPLITLVATVAVVIVWYRCHVRLRAKAYGRLAISGAFVASFLLCLGAVSSVLGRRHRRMRPTIERSPSLRYFGYC